MLNKDEITHWLFISVLLIMFLTIIIILYLNMKTR